VDDSQEIIPPKNALTAFKQTVLRGTLPMVFVGANLGSRTMMETLQKAYEGKRSMFFVKTLAEARQILQALASVGDVQDTSNETTEEE
jgi:isopentenyl diphosphate isomerase/L-lactate dehydrogenase-like FMN-dependent dehydrogenase